VVRAHRVDLETLRFYHRQSGDSLEEDHAHFLDQTNQPNGKLPDYTLVPVGYLLVVMISLELCTTYSSSCHHHFNHP